DPVRAKGDGHWKKGESLPGMPAEMWDLWPGELEESEIGEIPKGWEVVSLSERCKTQYGYTASATKEPIGPHLLRVTDINKSPWIDWHGVPFCPISESERQKYALSEGDIVVARMADPGKCAIIEGPANAVFASYLVRLRVGGLARAYYTFYFLRSASYQDYAQGAKSGSVQANMNARIIVDVPHLDPPQRALDAFLRLVAPLRRKVVANLGEQSTLGQTRDTLLPKLLSGEIRV
ncbi:type I restriction-modification system specificity subunit, partial [mine drainage metagenome]